MRSSVGVIHGMLWFLLLFHISSQGFTVAQNLESYINGKEEQVRRMAAEILRLDAARCELAANCSSSCSRHACTPIGNIDDPKTYNFKCEKIDSNPYCSAPPGQQADCNAHKVNYAMSYIRMPPNASISQIPDEMCSTICMTRDLTSTTKDLASMDPYQEAFYFGSVEGVIRMYPGQEENQGKCFSYDPRRRPWYNGAISVRKRLDILIDHSYVTGTTQVPSPLLFAIDASKKIVHDIIYTLSSNDVINVIAFNETNAIPLSPNPVLVGDDTGLAPTNQMQTLLNGIGSIIATQDSIPPSTKGFQDGILSALEPDEYGDGYLRVILLFTNGGFATQLQAEDIEHVSGMIKNQSSRVFTYSFDKSDNLKLLASEAGGYFEILNANFDNPLYQISSYFNFMALARNASEDTPYWTKYYVNYGELDNIITVSYQVVNSKGHLIGVVAIDILLQSVLNNLPIILGDRSGIRPNNPNATLDARVGASNNICPFCEGSKVVCPRTGNMTFVDLNCCNNCNSLSAPQSPPIIPDGKKWSTRSIALVSALPAGVLLLLLALLLYLCNRIRNRKPAPDYSIGPYQ